MGLNTLLFSLPLTTMPFKMMSSKLEKSAVPFIIFCWAVYLILSISSLLNKSPVRDEPVHYAFAYGILNQGDETALQRGVGPVSILNILAAGGEREGIHSPATRTAARIPSVILGGILLICIAGFSWQLFGPGGALFAVILAAFEPNLIAHGRWVTTDLAVALGFLVTIWSSWRFYKKPSWFAAAIIGACFGFTLLAKVSGLIFILLFPVFWIVAVLRNNEHEKKTKPKWFWFASFFLMLSTAWIVLNAGFGFYGSFRILSDYSFNSSLFKTIVSILPGWTPVPFPSLFTRCLDHSFWFTELGHPVSAYLFGEFSPDGFPHYYATAFLIKSTAGFLILSLITVLLMLIRKAGNIRDDLFLYIPVIALFLYFSFLNTINIGLRYILPVYPLLCIAAGRLFPWARKSKTALSLCVILLLSHVGASLFIYPDYLEFFNCFAGGPSKGYKYLSDSNLAWGQDIERVKEYIEQSDKPVIVNPAEPVNGRIAVNTNRLITEKYAWLADYQPISRIGYTWYIYDITDQEHTQVVKTQPFKGMKGIKERLKGPEIPGNDMFRDQNPPSVKKPNVLMITVDTLRADHLGSYGHRLPVSPVLDTLVRRGILFPHVRCQIPRTTPSHASIFTGMYPGTHGSSMNCQPINESAKTLASILKQNGFETGAVVASAVVSARASGLDKGFDYYEDATGSEQPEVMVPDPPSTTQSKSETEPKFLGKIQFAGGMGEMQSEITPYERHAEEGTDLALSWMKNRANGPFFFWMHYFDPHSSYAPPGIFNRIFEDNYSRKGTVLDVIQRKKKNLPINLHEINRFHGMYDGEIRYVDQQLSRIFSYLSQTDQMDNTIIILTADHGETLGEYHDYVGHGEHLNEGSVHIPLLLILPGLDNSRIFDGAVESIDIMPTLLKLLKLPQPTEMQGQVIPLPSFSGNWPLRETFFIQSAVMGAESAIGLRVAYCTAPYKYICDVAANLGKEERQSTRFTDSSLTDFALYDLEKDPEEIIDLKDEYPDLTYQFRAKILDWLTNQSRTATERESVSDENRKILEALGYLQ